MPRQKRSRRRSIPQYRTVAETIIRKIQNGEYAPGEKLDGMRDLAKEYGVGFQVIISAIQALTLDDYVVSRPKSGVFVNPQKLGRFSRFGVFVSRYNPCAQGTLIGHLHRESTRRGYDLVLGTDYEEGDGLRDWLASRPCLDGVFLVGMVADKDLAPLRKSALPYLVLGNHPIAATHPQLIVPVAERFCEALAPHFAHHAGKRIAAMVGSKTSRPDREVLEGVRKAIVRAGGTVDESLLLHSEAGGLREVTVLLEEGRPDVLYLHGLHREYARYSREHPAMRRPFLLISAGSAHLHRDDVDAIVEVPADDAAYAAEAVDLLAAQVDRI